MRIAVKRIGGSQPESESRLDLEFPGDSLPDLSELKQRLEERTQIPVWAQRLFHKGRYLRGPSSLLEQGVPTESPELLLAASAHYRAPAGTATSSTSVAASASAPSNASSGDAAAHPPSAQAAAPENLTAPTSGSASAEDLTRLSISELKKRLRDRGVSIEGCTEKADLIERLRNAPPALPTRENPRPGSGSTGAGTSPAQASQSSGPVNPMAMFFQQLGPLMGNAMNQPFMPPQAAGMTPGTSAGFVHATGPPPAQQVPGAPTMPWPNFAEAEAADMDGFEFSNMSGGAGMGDMGAPAQSTAQSIGAVLQQLQEMGPLISQLGNGVNQQGPQMFVQMGSSMDPFGEQFFVPAPVMHSPAAGGVGTSGAPARGTAAPPAPDSRDARDEHPEDVD